MFISLQHSSLNTTDNNLTYSSNKSYENRNVEKSNHIQIIFTSVLVIYILCAILTLTSFKELNISDLNNFKLKVKKKSYEKLVDESSGEYTSNHVDNDVESDSSTTTMTDIGLLIEKNEDIKLFEYLKNYFKSIILVPKPLILLCITNYFCWSSLICYSLYFTDFVAKEIFG